MADPLLLPSAPIGQFDETTIVEANDYLALFQTASGKTLKVKASRFGIPPSTNYNWVSTFEYSLDDIVAYNGFFYKSLQNTNEGNVPNVPGSLFWELSEQVVSPLDHFRGSYNLSLEVYPSTGGTGPAGIPAPGDYWYGTNSGDFDVEGLGVITLGRGATLTYIGGTVSDPASWIVKQ